MKYQRRRTRPARTPETEPLEAQIKKLTGELIQTRFRLTVAECAAERFEALSVALGNKLRAYQNRIAFLEGRAGLGHEAWDIRRLF